MAASCVATGSCLTMICPQERQPKAFIAGVLLQGSHPCRLETASMARTCTVCSHESVADINEEIVRGVSAPVIAAEYGTSPDAILRHRAGHLLPALAEAASADVVRAEGLVECLWRLQDQTLDALHSVKQKGDLRLFFSGVREARATYELLAKLGGLINADQPQNQMTVKVEFEKQPELPGSVVEGMVRVIEE